MKKNFEQLREFAEELFQNGFSAADVYTHILMEFYGTPYVWGGSSPQGSDCSGSVCAALSLATGKNVRVTADVLFKNFFTEDIKIFNKERFLYAAFFLDENGITNPILNSLLKEDQIGNINNYPEYLCIIHQKIQERFQDF